MHEESLNHALDVVPEHQCQADLLIHGQRLLGVVNLLSEGSEDGADDEGSRILKEEHGLPRDLRAQVLEHQSHSITRAYTLSVKLANCFLIIRD